MTGIPPKHPPRRHAGGKPVIDMSGKRYGELLVIERAPKPATHSFSPVGSAWWRCRCDCGQEAVFSGTRLRYGATRYCKKC